MDNLAALRAEIDGIDDALHDLLMRRASVVLRVALLKAASGNPVSLRPGREAAILRRLLTRHHGKLPPATVLRIWRELLAGAVAVQGSLAIAVAGPGMQAVAREQFGALTDLLECGSDADCLAMVAQGRATAGVLAFNGAWWTGLDGLFLVGRLPFWAVRPRGAPTAAAFVVAANPPDPSGDDRSLVIAPRPAAMPGFRVLLAAPDGTCLLETDGWLSEGDPRLAACGPGARLAGAYAVPYADPNP